MKATATILEPESLEEIIDENPDVSGYSRSLLEAAGAKLSVKTRARFPDGHTHQETSYIVGVAKEEILASLAQARRRHAQSLREFSAYRHQLHLDNLSHPVK